MLPYLLNPPCPPIPLYLDLENTRDREQSGEFRVRVPHSLREGTGESPEELERDFRAGREVGLQIGVLELEELRPLVGHGPSGAGNVVDERHLSKKLARAQDGERLFPHMREHLGRGRVFW